MVSVRERFRKDELEQLGSPTSPRELLIPDCVLTARLFAQIIVSPQQRFAARIAAAVVGLLVFKWFFFDSRVSLIRVRTLSLETGFADIECTCNSLRVQPARSLTQLSLNG